MLMKNIKNHLSNRKIKSIYISLLIGTIIVFCIHEIIKYQSSTTFTNSVHGIKLHVNNRPINESRSLIAEIINNISLGKSFANNAESAEFQQIKMHLFLKRRSYILKYCMNDKVLQRNQKLPFTNFHLENTIFSQMNLSLDSDGQSFEPYNASLKHNSEIPNCNITNWAINFTFPGYQKSIYRYESPQILLEPKNLCEEAYLFAIIAVVSSYDSFARRDIVCN